MLHIIRDMMQPHQNSPMLKHKDKAGPCSEMSLALVLCLLLVFLSNIYASPEVCTNSLIPGAKGEQGEAGEEGDQGKLGKNGPPGLPGVPGEPGLKGEMGHEGKMGPTGDKGDKGHKGLDGAGGLKGKPGTTCDCGRYRKVVEQLNVNIGKLGKAVKFVKNVVLGMRETEEMYYLLVRESRRFRDAVMNCKLRGGTLVMPKTINTNRLISDYISQAGLTRIYIGVQVHNEDTDGIRSYIYADSSPLRGFSAWSQEERPSTNSTCVELLSTGTWGHVECESTMFFICEFPKSRRRGGGRGTHAVSQ